MQKIYRVSENLAARHPENFPVASFFLRRNLRPHVSALYAFARCADDFADEGDLPSEKRLKLLHDWEKGFLQAYKGKKSTKISFPEPQREILLAFAATLHHFRLTPRLPLLLLSAFRQDVRKKRYHTWREVFSYCRRSANPIGRLVLIFCGCRDARMHRYSDFLCTALQLTNFWQDTAKDFFTRGRLYYPLSEFQKFKIIPPKNPAEARNSAFDALVHSVVARTKALFEKADPLRSLAPPLLQRELKLTFAGGLRVLEKIERLKARVWEKRPKLQAFDWLLLTASVLGRR